MTFIMLAIFLIVVLVRRAMVLNIVLLVTVGRSSLYPSNDNNTSNSTSHDNNTHASNTNTNDNSNSNSSTNINGNRNTNNKQYC